jgi:hypothetical protein
MDIALTSELDAVNTMLTAIGESPVNSLTGDTVVDVLVAQAVLKEVSRKVQSGGLHCNTDSAYKLQPDIDGYITLPVNILRIDGTESYNPGIDITQRAGKLYDKTGQTSIFTQDIYCDVTWFLDFDELPEHVRHYIALRATRIFAHRMVGAENLEGFTRADEAEAMVYMQDGEGETADYNIFSRPEIAGVILR